MTNLHLSIMQTYKTIKQLLPVTHNTVTLHTITGSPKHYPVLAWALCEWQVEGELNQEIYPCILLTEVLEPIDDSRCLLADYTIEVSQPDDAELIL